MERKLGEVWEDAEGCLYTVVTEDGRMFAFGTSQLLDTPNDMIPEPMRRVFLEDGTLDEDFAYVVNYDYVEGRLRYPHGHNIRSRDED
jgi:hypothetical protein